MQEATAWLLLMADATLQLIAAGTRPSQLLAGRPEGGDMADAQVWPDKSRDVMPIQNTFHNVERLTMTYPGRCCRSQAQDGHRCYHKMRLQQHSCCSPILPKFSPAQKIHAQK